MNNSHSSGKLVGAEQLLEELFAPACKPSLRWLRKQTSTNAIPCIRLGRRIFFDVGAVREILVGKDRRCGLQGLKAAAGDAGKGQPR